MPLSFVSLFFLFTADLHLFRKNRSAEALHIFCLLLPELVEQVRYVDPLRPRQNQVVQDHYRWPFAQPMCAVNDQELVIDLDGWDAAEHQSGTDLRPLRLTIAPIPLFVVDHVHLGLPVGQLDPHLGLPDAPEVPRYPGGRAIPMLPCSKGHRAENDGVEVDARAGKWKPPHARPSSICFAICLKTSGMPEIASAGSWHENPCPSFP